jgi:hypothetical protein
MKMVKLKLPWAFMAATVFALMIGAIANVTLHYVAIGSLHCGGGS